MRLAAIDIGSNAVRLLISEIEEEDVRPNKLKLLRIPIRLGFDTFKYGKISQERMENLQRTMKVFKLMMEIYNVKHYRACATSAMRDAANQQEILTGLKKDTGIDVEIISGDEEATIIYETHIADILDPEFDYLYIDVGGGSTELTLFSESKVKAAASFNIGTIRILNDLVDQEEWNKMLDWVSTQVDEEKQSYAIGSGGNINTIFQLSRRKLGRPLTYDFLRDFSKELAEVSIEERMKIYNMKPDRADVIIPACSIFINILRKAHIHNIYVPQIGLVDGIVQLLANKYSVAGTNK